MLRKNLVVRKNFVPLHPQLSNKGVADTGCSAVGSVPGLGPGCRRFESCHPDEERIIQVILSFFIPVSRQSFFAKIVRFFCIWKMPSVLLCNNLEIRVLQKHSF